jgi:hypothetical protein
MVNFARLSTPPDGSLARPVLMFRAEHDQVKNKPYNRIDDATQFVLRLRKSTDP